ncbi:MAG TPA: HEAT repeat domain-containing protein [Bryobacteraceae bacterium]|nr:HEAT repeat domain-containing protein [Bryobacteraceae bacterium]
MFRYTFALLMAACIAASAAELSREARDRIRYARQVAKAGNSQSISELAPYLDDSSVEVRLEAVQAIAQIGTQYSLDPLVRATRDNDPGVQMRAVEGLVNFYLPGYTQGRFERVGNAIKGRFTDTNDQVIPPYVGVREDVIKTLGVLARGGSSMESRAAAARATGVLRGRAALPDLLEALRSKDDTVLYETIVALQKINDPSVAPRVSVYVRDLNDRVQIAALETVGLLRYEVAIPDLEKVYKEPRTDRARRAALTSIAMMPEERNRGLFTAALADRDDMVRTAAAEGLGRLKQASDLDMLERAFNEERRMAPRLAFAFAVVKLGRTELTEFSPLQYLVNTLNSRSYHGTAEGYLSELARQAMVHEQLCSVLPQATRDEKIGLARVLAASGDARTRPHLEKLSRETDPQVAEEALRALRVLRVRTE